jgi:hypothetical protein
MEAADIWPKYGLGPYAARGGWRGVGWGDASHSWLGERVLPAGVPRCAPRGEVSPPVLEK